MSSIISQEEKEQSGLMSVENAEQESILSINTPSLQEDTSALTSSIVTNITDDGTLEVGENGLPENGQIIITSDGIVWTPGGALMLSRQDVENLQGAAMSDHLESTGNDGTEFDIKVDSNPISHTSYKVENAVEETDDSGETSFSINQSVLQEVQSRDNELRQINFGNNQNMAQFQVQLSLNDLHNLQKITNQNVLMSQAALPEDTSNKHSFLSTSPPPLGTEGDKNVGVVETEEAKQFLSSDPSFSSDEHGNLFIKNEVSAVQHEDTDEDPSTTVKSEITQKHSSHEKTNQQTSSSTDPNCLQSIVYVQVQNNGQTQIVAVGPTSIQSETSTINQTTDENRALDSGEEEISKKKQTRKIMNDKLVSVAGKETKNSDKIPALRTLAPRLLSYPLYASAQASLGIGKTLLKPYNYGAGTIPLLETGQYFEVLGRCTLCFRFSRTTSYCRSEKNHRDPKASVCLECETAGLSTVVCRRKLNHTAPNAQPLNIVINTALQSLDHVKQLCVRNYLPACFAELHSIVVHHADITFVAQRHKSEEEIEFDALGQPILDSPSIARKPADYARGYLYPYQKEKWEQWLNKFCHQTGTNYRIRTGKRINKKTDHHGLANHNGKVVLYRTLETQLYNCALGGKPRKRKQKEGTRKRKERGSKLIGCSAVIHTRLIETKFGWKALEITVPKILAHLPFHDPRQTPSSEALADFNEVLVSQINPQLQQSGLNVQPPAESFDFVSVVADCSTDAPNQHSKETTPAEIRKNTKHMLLTCASLVDTIESADVIAAVQVQTQELLNKLLQEATLNKSPGPKKKRKRLETNSLLNDDDILEIGETI